MIKLWFLFPLIVFLLACENREEKQTPSWKNLSKEEKFQISQNSLKKAMLKEQQQIKDYIQRKGGTFNETPTGVHYLVLKNNPQGKNPKDGEIVEIRYNLSLLKGDTLKKNQTEVFALNYENKESGLFEVFQYIKTGEKALVIIPSYRAHGLVGNDNEIPPLSTLIYLVEFLSIQ